MGYYKNPEEMFSAKAAKFQKEGNRHWAMAKNGLGNHHYGQARSCYKQAAINQAKAERARTIGAVFGRKNGR